MGFIKKIFTGKTEYSEEDYYDYDLEYEDPDWDRLAGDRQPLELNDVSVCETYVKNCLETMKGASDEIDRLNKEYEQVNDQLKDLEVVSELPEIDQRELAGIAKSIKQLRGDHDSYVLKESTMTDREYKLVESIEDDIVEAIKKLEEQEDYKKKIKADLKRIDRERHACDYRKKELEINLDNSKSAALVAIGAAGFLFLILFLMQVGLKLDVVIGYYITIGLAAIALTAIYVKYADFSSEKSRVNSTINELILLENKVKIRYVNNKNLLDYLYMKYDVVDAWTLKDLYARFDAEREARSKFEKNEKYYQEELAKLVRTLRACHVIDPEAWVHRIDALLDQREIVEVRHSLIQRRQKLRKQIEYNQNLAKESGDSIKALIEERPRFKDDILKIINSYEGEEE
ncbi:MAG: hypothetical protein MJ107_01180 [Lachnospiraceae bacterium]|nr:hypothetical protein [Lachnospiraceae bacterium]